MNWSDYLKPGDGAIDIGANVGSITARLAEAVGPTGYVLAVEPDSENMDALVDAVGCLGRLCQVHVVQAVVTDTYGELVDLHHDRTGSRHSLWQSNLVDDAKSSRVVPTVTLDGIAPAVPNLKLIKVDTQGAECLVLAGATETLKKDLVWHVEVWPTGLENAGGSVQQLLAFFRGAGYEPQNFTWNAILHQQHGSPYGSIDVVFARAA